ncbi:hypothetical protein TWF225_007086 [Orbilia oligospora]|nr:hypothetical protein TWF225_007086 [Orbilia oligospora]KAF3270049.1 hypothetical protein TWF217_008391 [Orbilia oligospora]KAF3270519.1 hypothetical protein TWF128_004280 [Orbilia oligospora]KAF3276463.1 hypothetical protein TWF132_002171 [Orbilia oligospora]
MMTVVSSEEPKEVVSDTSLASSSKENLDSGLETFEAPVVGHGIPIVDFQSLDPIFEAKSRAISNAIQHIGWGRYQWKLFLLSGFGWFVDNMFMAAVSATLPTIRIEFKPPNKGVFLCLGQQMGLLVGAFVFGLGSDAIGRTLSFNMTLLLAGIFGFAVAGGPNYIGVAFLMAVVGLGAGGNMPINSALFLEFCPQEQQWVLAVLSVWWSLSSAFLALLAWPFLMNFSCPLDTEWGQCPRSKNMGWRYLYITIATFTLTLWMVRFFFFKLHESPKYLLAQGRDAEAIAVVDAIAKQNGKENILSVHQLEEIEANVRLVRGLPPKAEIGEEKEAPERKGAMTETAQMFVRSCSVLSGKQIRSLFATKKLAISTSMVMLLWMTLSISWNTYNLFLPVFIAQQGIENGNPSLNTTYRNYALIGICQIPGSFIGGWLIEQKALGRRGTLALASLLSGGFLFGYTQAKSQDVSLGFQCASAVMQNIIWGILYTYTPEIFPSPQRGTGVGLCSCLSNLASCFAPVLGYYSNVGKTTIYVCGSLFVFASGLVSALPYESRGVAAL